ncbi:uncharacterized protein LOC124161191 [Ischnura elegans]|uniref:uncharacterized protein LOC124161191 n=1 Tax=Ischnura elegans TaxID=197161 RepID=UPI001ED89CA2|nr:uncharacterized protein LOC124161191 [Ischnura elegans]XP_046393386.1 uncharacterized protein LOC124161191 [Ischnura elegans]
MKYKMKGLPLTAIILVFSVITCCYTEEITDDPKIETSTKIPYNDPVQPYFDTIAEKWAFDLQMAKILKENQGIIQQFARSYILKREQNHAKIPDDTIPVTVNGLDGDHDYKLYLKDGVINGLEEITYSFEKILLYEDVMVIFLGEVKYPTGIKGIQSFIASTNETIMGNGKTTAFVEKLHFDIKIQLNLKERSMEVNHLENNCHSIVKVNFEGRGPMELSLIQAVAKVAKDLFTRSVLEDVQKLTLTAMQTALEQMKGSLVLPPYDYGKDYTHFDYVGHRFRPIPVRCSKKSKNPVVMKAVIRTSSVGINYPENLQFIQNDPEMTSFFELLRNGIGKYLNDVFQKTRNALVDRGLQVAKLSDIELTFKAENSSTDWVGSLKITNGWVSGVANISRGGMDFLYVNESEIQISARVHLPKEIEVNQAFNLDLETYKGAGGLRGTTDYLIYMARMAINLRTFEATLRDFYLVCLGEVKYQVAVIETEKSSYEVGLMKAASDSFNHSVSVEIGKLIRHSLEYALSKVDTKDYIPPWDYTRVCDRRVNLDPKYRMCGKADLALAQAKMHGRGFGVTIKSNPVPFISTELELEAFGEQLLASMDNYLKDLIYEARRILILQDLKKLRYKNYNRPWNAKGPDGMQHFGTVSIFGGVLENVLSLFNGNKMIDNLEFDDEKAIVSAKIPFWWTLKFQANASVIMNQKVITTPVKGELNSLIYRVKLHVYYSKKVTIEEFRVECLGDGKFWTKFSYNDNWLRESVMEHLNGYLAQDVWPSANQILKRSFQDAVNTTNISSYLPHKDYYNYENNDDVLWREKDWKMFNSCGDSMDEYPTIKGNLEAVKTVDFKTILPMMKTEALRRNLGTKLRENSHQYINYYWKLSKERVSSYGHPPAKRISFYPELLGGEQEAILEVRGGWFTLNTKDYTPSLRVRDTAYGENSSYVIMLSEDISKLEVVQNFTLQIPDERINGSIEISAEGLRNYVAIQFFILTNHLEILDYDLYCMNQTVASITGLPADFNNLKPAITLEIMKKAFIPFYKEYLVAMIDAFEYAVKNNEVEVLLLPDYVSDKHLFSVVVLHDPDEERHKKRNRMAIECLLEEEPDIFDLNEYPPFIGTEAEWAVFSKLLVTSLNSLKVDLQFSSLTYMFKNGLDRVSIPDISDEVMIEDSLEVKTPSKFFLRNGTLTYLFKSTRPSKIYFDEESNEIVLLSYLDFKDLIQLNYDIMVNTGVATVNGKITGYVREMVYSYKVRIKVDEKHFRLENPVLQCIKGIDLEMDGESIVTPKVADFAFQSIKREFMTTVLDDLEKFLTISLLDRIMEINREEERSSFLPEWNYEKDYSSNLNSDIDEDFNICPTKLNFFHGSDGLIYYSE